MRVTSGFSNCLAALRRHGSAGLLLALIALPACFAAAAEPPEVTGAVTATSGDTATSQEPRIALVIGNANYPSSPLLNPLNDARAVAQALQELGFRVTLLLDATIREMADAAREFGDALPRNGVGLFYYAGHAMQIRGRNFLIPVGADIRREDEVAYNAFDAGLMLEKMEAAHSRVNIVILDACRNNPFSRSFRSASQGLAQMDAPVGSYVAFATSPAKVASDGSGGNGLYTQHLLEAMRTSGLKIEEVFKRVRVKVMADSAGQQIPWDSSSLTGDFYFVPPDSTVTASAQAAPTQSTESSTPTVPAAKPGTTGTDNNKAVAEKRPLDRKVPGSNGGLPKPPATAHLDHAATEALASLYKTGMAAKAKGDIAGAAAALSRAADGGHPGAEYEMGLLLKLGRKPVSQDLVRAQRLFLASAEQGNAQAQYEAAQAFSHGLGIAKNCAQATKWALKSAQTGSTDAAVLLGELYRVDCDGTKNPKEAARWLRVAADKGAANAQFSLGVLYVNGDGVTKDPQEARKWLNAAASKGHTSARFYLDRIGN